jgi:hypothetical protein
MIVPMVVATTAMVRDARTGPEPSRRREISASLMQGAGNAGRQAEHRAHTAAVRLPRRSTSVKITIAIIIAALLTSSNAFARSPSGIPVGAGPGGVPFGAGTQRGMQDVNNSGQNGFVTLFARGARTAVVVALEGVHHDERIAIVRGNSCAAIGATVAAAPAPLHRGISRSYVPITMARLLSGNYLTVVYGNTRPSARPVACGELYS